MVWTGFGHELLWVGMMNEWLVFGVGKYDWLLLGCGGTCTKNICVLSSILPGVTASPAKSILNV